MHRAPPYADYYCGGLDMNKGLMAVLGCLGVLLFGAFIVAVIFFGQYNRLVKMNEEVKAQWAQVDNQLKRRNDLIPNLEAVVKGASKHEKDIFDKITQARAAYGAAKTSGEKMQIANQIGSDLSRLLVIVESNPQMQAMGVFRDFMVSLESTENRISTERGRYNELVKTYNQSIKVIPGKFFAGMLGYKEEPYFETPANEKAVPKVDLGN